MKIVKCLLNSSCSFKQSNLCVLVLQNGLLLRKYTYLSNDSCYSVSPEDGVEISILDNNCGTGNDEQSTDLVDLSYTSSAADTVQSQSSKIPSFSFEAQVIILVFIWLCVIEYLASLFAYHLNSV